MPNRNGQYLENLITENGLYCFRRNVVYYGLTYIQMVLKLHTLTVTFL